ncbi:DUF5709 domain-containing protein [Nocardioides bizhenqiangii]|uniref:DUF5709 domain-containing protein n=1 Tax=Nocardioides bizhenqiangii TaxID=3095076 RepID=A0ABZ0ZN51_9ACTN|nr:MULTISPECIES: DUF5709 domain-containing protein [unclassified Nocardioides]MDZ5621463.1 DUF5709 domain-containing protein [Nocardioides sp. HM23]WQQ25700.1 DUF5709 domain-containing protein [Nocardioides sp. HM61]
MTSDDVTPDPQPETESYGEYSVDDEDQLQPQDTLADPDVDDALDRGYSPPEKYSAAQGFGNTPAEEAQGETLEMRIAQEEPEPDPYLEAEERSDALAGDEDDDHEVGDDRAGRLVAPDEGAHEDTEAGLVGTDVGIDGAAASAEEAAVHVIPDDEV